MRNKLFFQFGSMLLALTMFTSCEKPIQELDQSDEVFLKSGSKDNAGYKYRLLVDSGLSDGFIQSYHYNDKGLADKFHISKPNQYSYSATMEYNQKNLMSKARAYVGTDEFDIVFTYENDKLVKETWYYPGTTDVYDEYINTYNNEGQLVKRDDLPYELYTLFHYDDDGNCTLSEIFYQGNLYYAIEFEYSKKIKNPFASVTGLPVTWFFVEDFTGPNRFTGIKTYFNDNGNQVILYQWRSEDTEIRKGAHQYPIYQNSYDVVNDMWTDQVWKYENYARKRASEYNPNKNTSIKRSSNFTAPGHFKFKGETFIQDIKEMRLKHENAKRKVTK